jgi:hypothetical protein
VQVEHDGVYVMAGRTSIAHRRKIRELEAKRDKLLDSQAKVKADLITTRANLSHLRKVGAS